MMIGNYYCYDNPAALINQLQTLMGNTSFSRNYNLLYTVYSIPNMALPFFGGYFVDKLGAPVCLVVFGSFILAGQVLFAFGASVKSWTIMWCGRVLFGLGGENLTVAQSALLAQWFRGKVRESEAS
jgi:MFS family permease